MRLMFTMLEMVSQVATRSLDIKLWGNPVMVAAGIAYVDKLNEFNLNLNFLDSNIEQVKASQAYTDAKTFVDHVTKDIREEDFFKKALEFREGTIEPAATTVVSG